MDSMLPKLRIPDMMKSALLVPGRSAPMLLQPCSAPAPPKACALESLNLAMSQVPKEQMNSTLRRLNSVTPMPIPATHSPPS